MAMNAINIPIGKVNTATKRAAKMQEEDHAHHGHDRDFFYQLLLQVINCAQDQRGAVVIGDDNHAFGQAGFEHLDFFV